MEKLIKISEIEGFKPTETEAGEKPYNTIKVYIDYIKGKGVFAYFQEGNFSEEHGTGFNSFSFVMFGSKSARLLIEPMTRKNQKKITELETEFLNKSNQELTNIFINNIKN